jgi:glycyl-tRNA synthetase beta chain
MADKLDTLAGMFVAGERPTGSRDPYGLRRAAQGLVRTLMDLPELTGVDRGLSFGPLVEQASARFDTDSPDWRAALDAFLLERLRNVLETRGADVRNVRAVTSGPVAALSPLVARRKAEVLPEFTGTAEFRQLAELFKRVRNIARGVEAADEPLSIDAAQLTLPAEKALLGELDQREPLIRSVVKAQSGYREAFAEASRFGPSVATFFDDVLVMAEEPAVRAARLRLLKRLELLILELADVSEIVPQES